MNLLRVAWDQPENRLLYKPPPPIVLSIIFHVVPKCPPFKGHLDELSLALVLVIKEWGWGGCMYFILSVPTPQAELLSLCLALKLDGAGWRLLLILWELVWLGGSGPAICPDSMRLLSKGALSPGIFISGLGERGD